MESALLRAQKIATVHGEAAATLPAMMTRLYMANAAEEN
jgi:hypothetical protein